MSAVNPLIVPIIVLIGLYLAHVLNQSRSKGTEPMVGGRFETIDGLRGYLAFFVFLHHSSVWYFYIQTGRWEIPPSNLYVMLGQGGVAMFFMVTSFLFVTKILDSRVTQINWFDFFAMRVARLVPVYLLSVLALFILVAIRSNWQINVDVDTLLNTIYKWVLFTIAGKPDVNGIARTSIMLASVTWSLPYEWYFYFCLPLISIVLFARVNVGAIIFSALALYTMLEFWAPLGFVLQSFIGGVVAAFVVRNQRLKNLLSGFWFSVASLFLLGAVSFLRTAFDPLALLLLSLAFVFFAAGNSFFGMLRLPSARWMGELSYGIYMLHGLVLFVTFFYVVGYEQVKALQSFYYWCLVAAITPVVILMAHIVHLSVERPLMRSSKELLRKRKPVFQVIRAKIYKPILKRFSCRS